MIYEMNEKIDFYYFIIQTLILIIILNESYSNEFILLINKLE
jgi:hypothetical protein